MHRTCSTTMVVLASGGSGQGGIARCLTTSEGASAEPGAGVRRMLADEPEILNRDRCDGL
jgi:hypothetical protein